MGAFVLSAAKAARVSKAVRAYNSAITRASKKLAKSGKVNLTRYLPAKTTVEDVTNRIQSNNDFRRIVGYAGDVKHGRTSELTRILKKVNPDALNIIETETGAKTTNYAQYEQKLNERALRKMANQQRENMQTKLVDDDTSVDFDNLSVQEYYTLMSETDLIGEDEGEYDMSVEDIDPQLKQDWVQEDAKNKREKADIKSKAEVYLDVWTNPKNMHDTMLYYDDVINALEWLIENKPEYLEKMFNNGADELDPNFISISDPDNPYVNTDYEVRHNRAAKYILHHYNIARGIDYSESV